MVCAGCNTLVRSDIRSVACDRQPTRYPHVDVTSQALSSGFSLGKYAKVMSESEDNDLDNARNPGTEAAMLASVHEVDIPA